MPPVNFVLVIFEMGVTIDLSRLASNCNPADLSLPVARIISMSHQLLVTWEI
jgi:hypothetical protein